MIDSTAWNSIDFRSAYVARFLLNSRMVQAGKEKDMVSWVRKVFERAVQQRSRLHRTEQLPLYIRELQGAGFVQDWQLRQTDQSVRLYFVYFLKVVAAAA